MIEYENCVIFNFIFKMVKLKLVCILKSKELVFCFYHNDFNLQTVVELETLSHHLTNVWRVSGFQNVLDDLQTYPIHTNLCMNAHRLLQDYTSSGD